MTDPVVQSIASALAVSRNVLSNVLRWPDLGAALGRELLSDANVAMPDGLADPPVELTPEMVKRSPELACLGYSLARLEDHESHEIWLGGFQRLMLREVYPADRDSFVQEPLELIGLAKGVRDCKLITDEHRSWFADQLEKGMSGHKISVGLPTACAQFAIFAAGGKNLPDPPVVDIATLSSEDLCILFGLTRLAPGWFELLTVPLEQLITRQILERSEKLVTPLQAAITEILLERTINRLAIHDTGASQFDVVIRLCRRFPLLIAALQGRQHQKAAFAVTDEYDVQDLLHGVLRLHFDDVRPEEYTPSYAGKSSRIDFLLPRERTIIEAKMTRPTLKGKDVADQLIIDKARYKAQPGVDKLICIVYDPGGYCANPVGLESDLSSEDPELKVAVIVTPHGI